MDSIKTVLLLFLILLTAQFAERIPWWSFVVPVVLLGLFVTYRQWNVPTLGLGFLTGFFVWFGVNIYVDLSTEGIILNKVGLMFSVGKPLLLVVSGLVGGMITELAFYTGRIMITTRNRAE